MTKYSSTMSPFAMPVVMTDGSAICHTEIVVGQMTRWYADLKPIDPKWQFALESIKMGFVELFDILEEDEARIYAAKPEEYKLAHKFTLDSIGLIDSLLINVKKSYFFTELKSEVEQLEDYRSLLVEHANDFHMALYELPQDHDMKQLLGIG